MTKTDKILIAIIILIGAFALTTAAMAEGPVYSGPTKTVNCTDATARTDGTPLASDEIDKVEVYIRTSPSAAPQHTLIMAGGCKAMSLDLTQLGEGQKYQDGKTYDMEGRVSAISTNLPFEYIKASPLAPVMTE